LAFALCEFEEAFSFGEAILARSRRLEHVDRLRWPTLVDEFDFHRANPSWHKTALARLAALRRRPSLRLWATYYYAVLYNGVAVGHNKSSAVELRRQRDLLRRRARGRYAWMLVEVGKELLYGSECEAAAACLMLAARATEPENW